MNGAHKGEEGKDAADTLKIALCSGENGSINVWLAELAGVLNCGR